MLHTVHTHCKIIFRDFYITSLTFSLRTWSVSFMIPGGWSAMYSSVAFAISGSVSSDLFCRLKYTPVTAITTITDTKLVAKARGIFLIKALGFTCNQLNWWIRWNVEDSTLFYDTSTVCSLLYVALNVTLTDIFFRFLLL